MSLTQEDAVSLAEGLLADEFGMNMKTAYGEDVVLIREKMSEFPIAWCVPFNTQQYLDTGDPISALIPSLIVVPKDRSIAPHIAPSALPVAEYLRQVDDGAMTWTVRD